MRWVVTLEDLARLDRRALAQLMAGGAAPRPEEVAGREWRGWNIAPATAVLGVRKFLKRIHRADSRGRVFGENVLARQNGIGASWVPRFGGRGILPFGVLPPGSGAGAGGWPRALVIDYGAWPGRHRWNPIARVVDHLVRPDLASPELLLGVSHLRLVGRMVFLEHFLLDGG